MRKGGGGVPPELSLEKWGFTLIFEGIDKRGPCLSGRPFTKIVGHAWRGVSMNQQYFHQSLPTRTLTAPYRLYRLCDRADLYASFSLSGSPCGLDFLKLQKKC
jgi:hypothetical protein